MELTLTDRLSCPRCGPMFGLILRADDLADRRVRAGILGCPNCRDSFAVSDGFMDLRAPPRGELGEGLAGSDDPGAVEGRPASRARSDEDEMAGGPDEAEASRFVALLGIHRGPGTVALVGRPARHAGVIARAVEDIQVAALDPDTRFWAETEGVSRGVGAPGLPFFSRMLRGVVADARLGRALLFDAARTVAPMSRIVVVHGGGEVSGVLEEAGLSVLAEEAETVVAARS